MSKTRVHQILEKTGSLVFPGVYDTLSARIAAQAGAPLAFVSGYSVSATSIGEPDFGLLTQTEMTDRARRICMSVDIPVIVDADTGYGNPLNVYRTVNELIAAGAAGCFLEDQVWPKKCGHMRGKKVIDANSYIDKVRAASAARDGRDFFIVARTDALAVGGMDDAIARIQSAREAGADGSFVEAPTSLDELAEIGRRSPAPNVANMIAGGRTPFLPKDELAELGFHLILHPLAGLFSAARAIQQTYRRLQATGGTAGDEERQMSFAEFNELIGLDEKYALGEQLGAE